MSSHITTGGGVMEDRNVVERTEGSGGKFRKASPFSLIPLHCSVVNLSLSLGQSKGNTVEFTVIVGWGASKATVGR